MDGDGYWFEPIHFVGDYSGHFKIGQYTEEGGYKTIPYNVSKLPDGWHHFAVVACKDPVFLWLEASSRSDLE